MILSIPNDKGKLPGTKFFVEDIGGRFLEDENFNKWMSSIDTHVSCPEPVEYDTEMCYLDSLLFNLGGDTNVMSHYENEINVTQPHAFSNNNQIYITAKNDPTLLLGSFEIDINERYQIEYIDIMEFSSYIPNREQRKPGERYFSDVVGNRKQDFIKWKESIDGSMSYEPVHYDIEPSYLDNTLFNLDSKKDSNVVSYHGNEVNIIQPHIFNDNDQVYITAKNDPTILLSSFYIDTNGRYQVEQVDENSYDSYISNVDGKAPGEKFFSGGIAEKFIKDENFMKWKLLIDDGTHDPEPMDPDTKICYFDSILFNLDSKKDSNVVSYHGNEVNITQPRAFTHDNKQLYITAKNDPMLLLGSFEIDINERYQVEYVSEDEFNSYVTNNGRKRPGEKFLDEQKGENKQYFYIYYKKLDGTIISVSGSPVKNSGHIPSMKVSSDIGEEFIHGREDTDMWKVMVKGDGTYTGTYKDGYSTTIYKNMLFRFNTVQPGFQERF